MTIHTVGKAGYGWSVVGAVEVEGARGFPVVAGCFAVKTFLGCEYFLTKITPYPNCPRTLVQIGK